MSEPLSAQQIQNSIDNDLSGWTHSEDKLMKDFKFSDFREAFAFMTRIAFEAEEQGHHPEMFNVYNQVKISLSTHDADGKVTEKDIKLATTIEALYSS